MGVCLFRLRQGCYTRGQARTRPQRTRARAPARPRARAEVRAPAPAHVRKQGQGAGGKARVGQGHTPALQNWGGGGGGPPSGTRVGRARGPRGVEIPPHPPAGSVFTSRCGIERSEADCGVNRPPHKQ